VLLAFGAKGITPTKGTTPDGKPATALVFAGPINSAVGKLGDTINLLTGGKPLYTVVDPTKADPRIPATTLNAEGKVVPKYVDQTGAIKMLRLLVPVRVCLLLPGDGATDLAICTAS
jgi:hypothetical protein